MVLILGLFLAAGLSLLPIPFTRDQGIYAYNAWRWLGGEALYRDSFGHKGPLLYLVYAVFLQLSGGAMWGPNLADLLARTLTVALAYVLGRELRSGRAGIYAALLTALPLFGVFNSCWWNAQAETFIMPLIAGSAALALIGLRRQRAWLFLLAGAVAGQAAMLKINSLSHLGFLLLLPAAFLLAANKGPLPGRPFALRSSGLLLVGAGLGLFPWLIYLAAVGSLVPMWECTVVFNSFHLQAALRNFEGSLAGLFLRRFWTTFHLIPVLMLFAFYKSGRERPERARELLFVFGFVLFSFFNLLLQARFFLYHYLVLVPAVGLAAGVGLDSLQKWLGKFLSGKVAVPATFLILVWLVASFGWTWVLIHHSYRTFDYVSGRIELSDFYARFSEEDEEGVGDFNLLASAAAAHHLREHTDEGASVLVFGYEPIVNYLSGRPAPGRFQIDYPLTFEPLSDRASHLRERWRAEFLDQLAKDAPAMIVLVDNDANVLEPAPSIVQAQKFVEFWGWLNEHYQEDSVIQDFHFYRRIEGER